MSLRDLPSVESLLNDEPAEELIRQFGRSLVLGAVRTSLEEARSEIRAGGESPGPQEILARVRTAIDELLAPTLLPVINATGVILHTNLGRAVLSQPAQEAVRQVAAGYSSLEYDLAAGTRGHRDSHVVDLLRQLTGAEAAMVVNNNAAAVILSLRALAEGRQALISRSQLVEIGGGFRIPEVMQESGANVVEVGTTNRTHLHDYKRALTEQTALIVRAHHSNFRILGFTTEPSLDELVQLGVEHGVSVLDDLGSGALLDTAEFGLGHEPMVQESLQAGADLITFSGDKLLGGPQAGIIVGREAVVQHLRAHPMARAVRPDKLCLAGLAATLVHYLKGEALGTVPVWQMISTPEAELQAMASAWADELGTGQVIQGRSTVGGGSLPEETLPTWLLAISRAHPQAFLAKLRQGRPPIIGRIQDERVIIDPRTVLPHQRQALRQGLQDVLAAEG